MRKIIYSLPLKIIAVLLLTASIVLGTLTCTAGIFEFYSEEEVIYSFERDFSDSWYVSYLLNEPELSLIGAYFDSFPTMHPSKTDVIIAEGSGRIAEKIKNRFENYYYKDKLDYYVKFNDLVITNCGASHPNELKNGEYTYVKRSSDGSAERAYTHRGVGSYLEELNVYRSESEIVICTRLNDETAAKYERIWQRQRATVRATVLYVGACLLAAVLSLVYLICVCGKRANGEYKNMWLDKVFLEVHLAFTGAAAVGAVAVCVTMIDGYLGNNLPDNLVYAASGAVSGAVSLIVLTSLLSVVRNVKTGRFLKTSFILRIVVWLWRIFVKVLKWIWKKTKAFFKAIKRALSVKTGAIPAALLLVYTALIGFLGIITPHTPIGLILAVLLFFVALFFIACRARDLDEIKKGAREIRGGDTGYKIPEVRSEDMKALSEDINDIAKGLDESVTAKVKAERMKAELITNVSHDLKTPITSIISYAELLSKKEGLSEEARDYVAVISKKGERLKKLTQDLFDISKAHSGDDEAVLERLDAALLLEQALAEHESEINASGLVFCTQTEKELFIVSDGRKMSRALGNLIDNALKYALKGTRVFVTLKKTDGWAEIELKNVSAYPLDFDSEQICSRFVRGDESRTKEGNGLGLAIAKSYTELCGGTFKIVLDGDMFKAIIRFKTV
jgi:signal transduction histidine kinase